MTFREIQNSVFRLMENPGATVSDHLSIANQLEDSKKEKPEYFRGIKAAFLSNFTIKGLPEIFRTRAIFHNVWADVYLGPYDQCAQEILDKKSGLYKFQPDLIYFLFDADGEKANHYKELASQLSGKVMLMDSNQIKAVVGNYWQTKYKEMGDFSVAPEGFSTLADYLMKETIAVSGATKKCLVLDLDNTLWKGVIGEDGLEGIKPDQDFQRQALYLYETGVILAINSKNNSEDVLEAIEKHPKMILRKNHFAAWRINWQDKATNMKELTDELMLGADSFVFVDDSPFERNIVANKFPEVAILSPESLKNYPGFHKLKITDEDRRRGQMYAEEQIRRSARSSLNNVEDFIKSLNLEVTIREIKSDSPIIPRIAQMAQKTNQFNMTTKRWSEDEIRTLLNERHNYKMWAVEAMDRFGDYGIIGFLAAKPVVDKVWEIDNFLMSCRILGRGIEKTLLARVIEEANRSKISKLIGVFIPTKKNKALCEDFYPNNGFNSGLVYKSADSVNFIHHLNSPYPYPENIKVNFS
ncbi:MAG: HAD-IIIC family phosphatase [Candidatus Harrisonbacteria bacterium]|nr:HAD-IIIC family phosphatase [Candidatus Harrisonbacteria bacterium]